MLYAPSDVDNMHFTASPMKLYCLLRLARRTTKMGCHISLDWEGLDQDACQLGFSLLGGLSSWLETASLRLCSHIGMEEAGSPSVRPPF